MQSAAAVRTTALIVSNRWINHSFEAKLWKKALALLSIRSRFFSKERSSSSKALIVAAPATVSATWLANEDFVVPFIRISSFAKAK